MPKILIAAVLAALTLPACGRASAGVSSRAFGASAPAAEREPCAALAGETCRRISRAEIWTAVQAALRAGRLPAGAGASAANLRFHAPFTASQAAVPLEVRGATYDAALREWRFVLASREDRRVLPFMAASPQSDSSTSVRSATADEATAAPNGTLRPADALVQRGKPARLQVFSASLHMSLQVLPLESGALHQTVRARVAGGSQVLQGEVVGPGQMESRF